MGLIAEMVGGLIPAFLLSMLAGYVFFRSSEPQERALQGSLLGFFACCVLVFFGSGNPIAGVVYIPGAILAFFVNRWRYRKHWVDDGDVFE